MFVLNHHDSNIKYEFIKGGYTIQDSKLYLSIQTKAVDDEAFPDCYYFSVDGYPIKEPLGSTTIQISTNPEDEPPNVYVYTTFHACEVEAEINLNVLTETEVETTVKIISEDVNYYNEETKPNTFIGTVRLMERSLGELWIPT